MSVQQAASGIVQILGVFVGAPLLVGLIQRLKAMLQGRRGPDVVQPLREIRRLWGKSGVAPEPRTVIYAVAPPLVATVALLSALMTPVAGELPAWPVGSDLVVLVGLLALGRFAIALAAWDTGGGFGLMGVARDLTIAVSGEMLMLLVVLTLALPANSTNLIVLSHAAGSASLWNQPIHWAAGIGFLLVILVETGRQPVDNPDTHLELTMIHEGPLLEYGGRELALLQWASAIRHWVVLVAATELLLPQPGDYCLRLLLLVIALLAWCVVLAVIETTQAKMRLLRVPVLLSTGTAACLIGIGCWLAGAAR